MSLASAFAAHPSDSEELRREKMAIFLAAGGCSAAGVVWAGMYFYLFGWGLLAALPLAFTVIVGSSMLLSHLRHNHRYAVHAQIACIVYVTALIQWTMGSVYDSGFVLLWSFLGPMLALIFYSFQTSLVWFGLFLLNLAITALYHDALTASGMRVPEGLRTFFFLMNLGVCSFVVWSVFGYFVRTAAAEHERAEGLLLAILPRAIAARLKSSQGTIADAYDSASVLFADMVGSTPLFSGMAPEEAVAWLNDAFTMFDRLIEKHGLEKIRTIGDNYMVAAGVPSARPDHAVALTRLALDMIAGARELPPHAGKRMQFRFGIHTGPLIAGVIGETKFQYDLWGDTVNTAARMESHGEVGRVHVSAVTKRLIEHAFECTHRGTVEIKGKGQMETWWVEGPRTA